MLGEKSLLAQNFSKAENAFNVVIGQYPKSESAPKALDGLGFIHENRGDFQKALEAYRQIADNPEWAKTLVGLRQQFNIGRVLEKMEHFEAAKAAFEKQLEVFPGTAEQPSVAAQQARAALDRLKLEHPDLFPAEPEEEKTAPAEQSTAQSSEISGVAPYRKPLYQQKPRRRPLRRKRINKEKSHQPRCLRKLRRKPRHPRSQIVVDTIPHPACA